MRLLTAPYIGNHQEILYFTVSSYSQGQITRMNHQQKIEERMSADKVFNPKVVKRGIIIFALITVLTLIGIFLYTNTSTNLEVWYKMNPLYLLIGLVFIFNDLFLGALRNHIFVREFVPGISLMTSVKANLANIFMGAVTPSQSGGGPAQWYLFYRHGVSIPDNISNSFYNWISTLIFFPISGALAIYILDERVPDGFVKHLTEFGFSVFLTMLIVVTVALFSPRFVGRLLRALANLLARLSDKWSAKLSSWGDDAEDKMKDYQQKCMHLIKTKPQLMLYSFLLTLMLYFNKYSLAYLFCMALGISPSFWGIIAVMAVQYLLLYFAPSPGGSGIAEVSLVALLSAFMASDSAFTITILHRSYLIFIPAILGAWVVLRQVSSE